MSFPSQGKNIYWKDVKTKKILFVDKGSHFETLDDKLIFWSGQESVTAQTWLNKNKVVIEKTKGK